MKQIRLLLVLLSFTFSGFSQISISDKYEISEMQVEFINSSYRYDAKPFVEGHLIYKFCYTPKTRELTAYIVNSSNLALESRKTINLGKNIIEKSNDWFIHAKDYSYFIFKEKVVKDKGRIIYYIFNRKTGEFIESNVAHEFANSQFDNFDHALSHDSLTIARLSRKAMVKGFNVDRNILIDLLNTQQSLSTVRSQEFEDKTIPPLGKGDIVRSVNYNFKISDEGKILLIKSLVLDRGGKLTTKIEKFHLFFRSDEDGVVNQGMMQSEFSAKITNFFFFGERVMLSGLYYTASKGEQYKGFFFGEINEHFQVEEPKFAEFPTEYHTKYSSIDPDDLKKYPPTEDGHIPQLEITNFKMLSDGSFFIVCEKMYYVQKHGAPRIHSHNVFATILSPQFKIVKNYVIPKYLYDANFGVGTVVSQSFLGHDYIYVFSQEDRGVKLPGKDSDAISLTRAILTLTDFVCYRINLFDDSFERFLILNKEKGPNFFRELFIDSEDNLFEWNGRRVEKISFL